MRRIARWLVAALALAALGFPAQAEIIDFKTRGKLAHLTQYVGTNNHRAILDDPYVAQTLKELTGEYYEKFNNFDLSLAKVQLSSPFIILHGSRWEDAFRPEYFLILLIDWDDGRIQTAISFEDGPKIIFSDSARFRELPIEIQFFSIGKIFTRSWRHHPRSTSFGLGGASRTDDGRRTGWRNARFITGGRKHWQIRAFEFQWPQRPA